MDKTEQLRSSLEFALRAIWVQEQTLHSLMNANAALEHMIRTRAPELWPEYSQILERANSQDHESMMSTIHDVEQQLDLVKSLKS